MRAEVFVNRLLDAARDRNTSPDKLARALETTINRVAEINPKGREALALVEQRIAKRIFRRSH